MDSSRKSIEVFRKPGARIAAATAATGATSSSSRHSKKGAASSGGPGAPGPGQSRLRALFRELEKEMETLYVENQQLRQRLQLLESMTGSSQGAASDATAGADPPAAAAAATVKLVSDEPDAFETVLKTFAKKNAFKTRHKLKAHTSKIVSSFKAPQLTSQVVKEYRGHRDGIWDIGVSNLGHPLIGTASADKTARIWGIDSGKCLLTYIGHQGSVNSICFHPAQDLVLTASGDGTAHVWKATALPDAIGSLGGSNLNPQGVSSEDSGADSSEEDLGRSGGGLSDHAPINTFVMPSRSISNIVRQPISTLAGHQGVVISCQWLDNDLAVTASWDKAAHLYNVETGSLLQVLTGHDSDLTYVACHPTQRLVATCSVDSTFRLWDFRESIHSVSVFQGHTESVTSAVFSRSEQIISGSDDRTVKVWDLRNMRAPVTNIQCPSEVNRLAVSQSGTLAVPHDNRQVVLYDLNGTKLLRLPRGDASKSHHRMVTSTCWANEASSDQWRSKANLFSAGFDRTAFGWSVRPPQTRDKGDDGASKKEKAAKDATF